MTALLLMEGREVIMACRSMGVERRAIMDIVERAADCILVMRRVEWGEE